MRRLWIADVHANLPAFEAVLADAGQVDDIVFAGDIVGFGPHPRACVDLLRQLHAQAILGNHDASILSIQGRSSAHSDHVDWDPWTFRQLTTSQRIYLASLPPDLAVSGLGTQIRVIHHPANAPYLHPDMPPHVLAGYFGNVSEPVVFCGHSHRFIDRTVAGHRFVCLPAVGQARNGDPRAGYAVETGEQLQVRFVAYDIEKVISDVKRIGLPAAFCRRWIRFLRTGFDHEWSREYREKKRRERGHP